MAGIESFRPPDLNNILEQQELNQLSVVIREKIQNVFNSRTVQFEELKVKHERLSVGSGKYFQSNAPVVLNCEVKMF